MKITSRHIMTFLFLFVLGIVTIIFFAGRKNVPTVEARDFISEQEEKFFTEIEVEEGDTLWSLSDEYMTSGYQSRDEFIEEVRQMNHITGSLIREGEKLIIPYYSQRERSF